MIRIPETVIASRLDGETVLLDTATGTYFGLDAVGSQIWEVLAQRGDRREIVSALLAHFEVSEEKLAADVAEFVRVLKEAGLIVVEDD